jgi:Uma2 family endonuclease
MIFKCFSQPTDYTSILNAQINTYIKDRQTEGFVVESKSVFVVSSGDNSLIKPDITVVIWMVKEQNIANIRDVSGEVCPSANNQH